MAAVGTVILHLTSNVAKFKAGLDAAQTRTKQLEAAVTKSSQLVAKAMAGVGVAAAGVGIASIRLAAQMEQTEIAFATLLGNAEKAKRFLAELEEFAARTPFELPGLLAASRKLLAFGFEAQSIIPMMTQVGDAIAALGGGEFEIQRLVRALGQMQARGALAGQEMLQITELGIPAWRMLAESLGVTVPEAIALVERRAIDAGTGIAAILEGLGREFGGAMALQARTTMGLWTILRDEVRITAVALGRQLIEALDLRARLAGAIEAMAGMRRSLVAVLAVVEQRGLAEAFQIAFGPRVRMAVVGLAGAIGLALKPALEAAAKKAWALTVPLVPLLAKGALLAVVTYNWVDAFAHSGRAMDKLVATAVALGTAFVFVRVQGVFALAKALGVATKAMYAKVAAATTLKAKLIALLALAGPKGWLVLAGAVAATAAALGIMNRSTSAARATLEASQVDAQDYADQQASLRAAAERAAQGQQALKTAMEEAGEAARGSILGFDQVHRLQEELAKAPVPQLQLPVPVPRPPVPPVPPVAPPAPPVPALPVVRPQDIFADWEAWVPTAPDLAPVAGAAFAAVEREAEAWTARLARLWEGVRVEAAETWGRVADFFSGLWTGITTRAVTAWTDLTGWLSGRWEAIRGTAARIWEAIRMAVETPIREAAAWLMARWTEVSTSLGGLWEGIRSGAATAWERVRLAVETPVRTVTDWLTPHWEAIGTQLGVAWESIRSAAARLWESIRAAIADPVRRVTEGLTTRWEELSGGLQRTWEGIRDTAARVWREIETTIAGVVEAITAPIRRVIDAVSDALAAVARLAGVRVQAPALPAPVPVPPVLPPPVYDAVTEWAAPVVAMPPPPPRPPAPPVAPPPPPAVTPPPPPPAPPAVARAVAPVVPPAAAAPAGIAAQATAVAARAEPVAEQVGRAVYTAVTEALQRERVRTGSDRPPEVVLQVDGQRLARALIPPLQREQLRTGVGYVPAVVE